LPIFLLVFFEINHHILVQKFLLTLLFSALAFGLRAQSFTNVDELLSLSDMDPLECEKALTEKGFTFTKTDGLKSTYTKYNEIIAYTITPRHVNYATYARSFFLEVNSRLIKQGFVLVSSEAVLEGESTSIKAQEYQKNKFTVWLWTSEDEDDETFYHIQVDNSGPSSMKKADKTTADKEYKYKGDKEIIDYGYWNVGLMLPRGIIAEVPDKNSSYMDDYTGKGGLGAKPGFQTGLGGFVGFNGLNNGLPRPLYLGLVLDAEFGMQPFSYEPVGEPYDEYTYNDFMKLAGGAGLGLAIKPSDEADFNFTFYYMLSVAASFGGTFDYQGTDIHETMTREDATAALIKSFGLQLKTGSVFGAIDFSNYTDKGKYTLDRKLLDPNSGTFYGNPFDIQGEIPIRQITLKIGVSF
jgi:hypothetical protein